MWSWENRKMSVSEIICSKSFIKTFCEAVFAQCHSVICAGLFWLIAVNLHLSMEVCGYFKVRSWKCGCTSRCNMIKFPCSYCSNSTGLCTVKIKMMCRTVWRMWVGWAAEIKTDFFLVWFSWISAKSILDVKLRNTRFDLQGFHCCSSPAVVLVIKFLSFQWNQVFEIK